MSDKRHEKGSWSGILDSYEVVQALTRRDFGDDVNDLWTDDALGRPC